MDEKKQLPLRLSKSLYNEILKWAEDDFRSVNGQIEYLLSECVKRRKKEATGKTIVLVGLVMSGEAMLITMGITFIFLPGSTILIPLTVALAHFGYSALSFHLARTKYVKRISPVLSHVISGLALIIYGLMALFVEFGI